MEWKISRRLTSCIMILDILAIDISIDKKNYTHLYLLIFNP